MRREAASLSAPPLPASTPPSPAAVNGPAMRLPLLLLLPALLDLALLRPSAAQYPPVSGLPSSFSDFETDVPLWMRWRESGSLLRHTMVDEALEHLQARREGLQGKTGREAWEARREYVRGALKQTLGRGLPDLAFVSAKEREAHSPLNATHTRPAGLQR